MSDKSAEDRARELWTDLNMMMITQKGRICAGNFNDLAAYQRQCGVLQGMELVRDLIYEVLYHAGDEVVPDAIESRTGVRFGNGPRP